jgi:thiamine-phosphate pyrophosphorylase
MASHDQKAGAVRAAPRLYLVTPEVADPAGIKSALADALGAADVAAVLLRLAEADERTLITRIKAVVPVVQDKGAALVLDGRADLAARGGADGAHLSGLDAFNAALATLKPDRIAGCGGLHSRHEAMLAAEAGADYVMFGEPDERGRRPSLEALVERAEWWAEVFEVPGVAFAGSFEEVEPLARTGVEFIALGDWVFADARGAASALREVVQRLATTETVA